ncbi:hypothetical protein FRC09_019709, partial [Ceratobasidium sp. 395]
GQVVGTSVGTEVYLKCGWRASGALALGLHGLQIILLVLRGPNVPRKRWFGWASEQKVSAEQLETDVKGKV